MDRIAAEEEVPPSMIEEEVEEVDEPSGQILNSTRSTNAVTSTLALHVTPMFAASDFPSDTLVNAYCCQPTAVGTKSL